MTDRGRARVKRLNQRKKSDAEIHRKAVGTNIERLKMEAVRTTIPLGSKLTYDPVLNKMVWR